MKALDNIGVICNPNQENFQKFIKMGFTLYPLGRQGVKLLGIFIKAGTGSVAMHFRNGGYFEMISIYNRFLPTGGYKKILREKGERFIKLTFELSDAKKEALRLKQMHKPAFGPMEFRRVFTSPTKGKQDARFSILAYPFPSDYAIAVAGTQHLTPDVTWQADLMDHPNGAVMLLDTLVAADSLEEEVKRYEEILDQHSKKEGKKRVFTFKNGSKLTFLSFADLDDVIPGVKPDASPYPAAVTFGVKSLETVKAVFRRNQVPYVDKNHQIMVPPGYVFNSAYLFEQV